MKEIFFLLVGYSNHLLHTPTCVFCLQDPQYMAQALTNMLLMDAVAGCLHSQRSIGSASKLAYFDRIKHEGVTSVSPEGSWGDVGKGAV